MTETLGSVLRSIFVRKIGQTVGVASSLNPKQITVYIPEFPIPENKISVQVQTGLFICTKVGDVYSEVDDLLLKPCIVGSFYVS